MKSATVAQTPSSVPTPGIILAWAKAWNDGSGKEMSALFTEDGIYDDYAFQASWSGHEKISQWVKLTVESIPDARVEILDAFQSGDRATVRWVFHGLPKHIGPIEGTGRSFEVSAVSVFELKNGKIQHVSDYYNLANLFRQIGLPSGAWTPPFGPDLLK
ncbi:nuclear transport factor 2 family protein [Pedobacter sp. PAMC26386]|nr:nuclear transport factor 2 family protein [Pedobacter sp. PAMC26386]